MSRPGIIGIVHARSIKGKLEKVIVEALKRSKMLALEISQAELKKYKVIWARPNFAEEFEKLRKKPGALKYRFDVDESFFTIATLAREHNVQIVPIDSEYLTERALRLEERIIDLGNKLGQMGIITFDIECPFIQISEEKVRKLQRKNPQAVKLIAKYNKAYYEMKWLEEIEREEFMKTRIKAKKPDLIIVGVGHYDGIKKAFNCRHIYRDEFVPSDFRRTYDRMIARKKMFGVMVKKRERAALPKPRKRVLRHAK